MNNNLKVMLSAIILTSVYFILNYYGIISNNYFTSNIIHEIYKFGLISTIIGIIVIYKVMLPSEDSSNRDIKNIKIYDDIVKKARSYYTNQMMIICMLATISVYIIKNDLLSTPLSIFTVICSMYNFISFGLFYESIKRKIKMG